MDAGLVGLIGAAIGATAGIAGALIGGRYQVALEREKWLRDLQDGRAAELRSAVKELTGELANAAHSMCWLTWLARQDPDKVRKEDLDAYNSEMHRVLPQVMTSHALLAGMDRAVHEKLKETVDLTYRLDARIGNAAMSFAAGDPATAAGLANLYEDSLGFHDQLLAIVPDVLSPFAPPANS